MLKPLPLIKTAAFTASLLLAAPAAFAQSFDAVRLSGAASGADTGSIGLAVVSGREYKGSDERRTLVLPIIDFQWKNGWFAGTANGVGYDFSNTPGTHYGVRLTADLGRKESRSSALKGMGDVDVKPEVGGFFNYAVTPAFVLTSSLRYGSGNDSDGLVVDLGAAYGIALAPKWNLGLGVGASYVNSNHMQSYFGVTAAQAVTSGYAPYTAGSGLRDVRANVALNYYFSPQISITGGLSASSLQGDAKDSPLTRKRSTTAALVGVTYSF